MDSEGYPLAGATVKWADGTGTTVATDGTFTLEAKRDTGSVTVSYLGFAPQTFQLKDLVLPLDVVLEEAGTALGEVQVTVRDDGRSASVLKARNIESVSGKELRKAPCCSLAESFENSPVVDLTYGDPLTGRREIQMLGLRGNYTQLTLEKRPMLDGLASPFALDLIPGPWVEGIQIGKGSGSLESGAQGLTGAINTELFKPSLSPKFFLNAFGSSMGRGELNLVANHQIGKKLWAGGALHAGLTAGSSDHDGDGFRDFPARETTVGLARLFRQGAGNWEGQWNILALRDHRRGGQLDEPAGGSPRYRIDQNNERLEVWGKTGYFGFAKPHQSLGFIYSTSFHELNNQYGERGHRGSQRSYYLNSLYHTRIVNDAHALALGGTIRSDNFTERYDGTGFDREETTVGAFGEYTFSWESSGPGAPYRAFTAIASLRADRHNLGGNQLSPRLNLKYNPSEGTAFRLSAGRGWRSPNALVDNLNWLASSRTLVTEREEATDDPGFLGLESAWNLGGNLTTNVRVNGRDVQLVVDFYHTRFQDQIILDAEQDAVTLNLYQLSGTSRANSFMLSANYELFALVDVKLAYKYNDVRQTYRGGRLREVPLTPRHRALATLGYDGRRVKGHLNYQWVGRQRLIDFSALPVGTEVAQPQRSPSFGLLNAQITYVANAKVEIYFGGENLTGVRQSNAIIGAGAPFTGSYFDATQVYQPLFGANAYAGVRWTLQ